MSIPMVDGDGIRARFQLYHDMNATETEAHIIARLRVEAEVLYIHLPAWSTLEPRGRVVQVTRGAEGTIATAHDASTEDWQWLQDGVPEQWRPRRRRRLQDGRPSGWVLPDGPEGWPP